MASRTPGVSSKAALFIGALRGALAAGRTRGKPALEILLGIANRRAHLDVLGSSPVEPPPPDGSHRNAESFGDLTFIKKANLMRWND
jgi:hypothetical protein